MLFTSTCRHNSLSVCVLQSVIGKILFFCAEMRSTQITSVSVISEPVTSTETFVATSVTPGIVKAHNIGSCFVGNCACNWHCN